jgi:mycothiol synthase
MPTHPTIDLFPFTSDADADLVVPFHNRALREMSPRRASLTTEGFRARFAQPQMERHIFGLMDDKGELAALGLAMWWVDGTNPNLVFLQNLVRPVMRRQGLGRRVLRRILEISAERGRSMLIADIIDTVPAGEAFATQIGADLGIREHINVVAVSDLDIEMLERWVAEGPARAEGYELLAWTDGYPEEHHGQIARLFVMADEDMPFEDAAFEPQAETAESVTERLDRSAGTIERTTSVVRHIASGAIVGFSEVVMLQRGSPTLSTTLTVVDRDHRGHAIGKWIKADAILRGVERHPGVTHIETENAFSNAPMLGINDAIGFRPEHTMMSYQATAATVQAYLDRT